MRGMELNEKTLNVYRKTGEHAGRRRFYQQHFAIVQLSVIEMGFQNDMPSLR